MPPRKFKEGDAGSKKEPVALTQATVDKLREDQRFRPGSRR